MRKGNQSFPVGSVSGNGKEKHHMFDEAHVPTRRAVTSLDLPFTIGQTMLTARHVEGGQRCLRVRSKGLLQIYSHPVVTLLLSQLYHS